MVGINRRKPKIVAVDKKGVLPCRLKRVEQGGQLYVFLRSRIVMSAIENFGISF
jgi:hypothetical protein